MDFNRQTALAVCRFLNDGFMRQLLPADPNVLQLIGTQKHKDSIAYRRTKYCIEMLCEDGLLLYHTMTGALVLLPKGETAADCREELIASWFLVPESYDEKRHTDELRTVVALLRQPKKHITAFTVVTTTDCNARCFYCYEKGTRRFSMSEQTAHDTAAYIARVCGGEEVSLTWFGGEPMYNMPAIDIICGDLRAKGIPFHSRAVSNGYFLDRETVKKARALWNMTGVQIAVDGTETVYNRTKAYLGCEENAYARVLQNISDALDAGIKVTVRLNMHPANVEDMRSLCDVLAERFGGRAGFHTQVITVWNVDRNGSAFGSGELSNRWFCEISEKAKALGIVSFGGPVRGIMINRCKADNPNTEAIYPDGSTGRCENYDPHEITGSIYTDERDQAVTASWKERLLFPECDGCLHYPTCIKLKNCIWDQGDCTEFERERRTYVLRQQILAAYQERKES